MTCIFCKIASGEMNARVLYKDDTVLAFEDISPQAPIHYLIIPQQHIATINDLQDGDENLIGRMVFLAKKLAEEESLAEIGYRLVFNCNRSAGQEVFHIHLHLLGGRTMQWPPG